MGTKKDLVTTTNLVIMTDSMMDYAKVINWDLMMVIQKETNLLMVIMMD